MSTAQIVVNLFNGRRQPAANTEALLTALDGSTRLRVRQIVNSNTIQLNAPVVGSFVDNFTVLVAASGHTQTGFRPLKLAAKPSHTVDLMLLRREGRFRFDQFGSFATSRPDLHAFLTGTLTPELATAQYAGLADSHQEALACLMNVMCALEQVELASPPAPLVASPAGYFKELRLDDPEKRPFKQDRFFAWADMTIADWLAEAEKQGLFKHAPSILHPGADASYKQTQFGEANVQLCIHNESKTIGGVACILIEADIDYFEDEKSHIMLEVFPNKLKKFVVGRHSSQSLTDPRTVFGLRWIAGRQLPAPVPFDPPYVLD